MSTTLYELAKTRRVRHSSIVEFMSQALKPKDYCDKWVPKFHDTQPGERGYRQLCIKEIVRITGYEESYVKNWGKDFEKAPDIASRLCAMASILNQSSTDWSDFLDNQ